MMPAPDPAAFVGAEALHPRPGRCRACFWPSLAKTVVWTAGSVAGAYALALALWRCCSNMKVARPGKVFRALLLDPLGHPGRVARPCCGNGCTATSSECMNFLLDPSWG